MEGGNAVWVSGHETLLLMGKSGAGGLLSRSIYVFYLYRTIRYALLMYLSLIV